MTIYKMCNGWAKGIESGEGNGSKRWKSCNVFYEGRTIYSYGHHFPMAYIVAPNLVWLNGDTFSVSTGRHQRELRNAIARTDATVVIVPNSALGAAGVDYKTIEPVDVKPERWEYTQHSSLGAPAGMSTELTQHVDEYSTSSQFYRCDVPEDCDTCKRGRMSTYHQTERTTVYPAHDAPLTMGYGQVYQYGTDSPTTWPDVVGYVNTEEGRQAVRHDAITGEYVWHTARHWLGDCVFTGERTQFRRDLNIMERERVPFISSFDKQERRPLYFLSQLPHAVSSVDEAIESLAPDSVKTARDMGRAVVRQGDMFAIPMDVTTRQLTKLGADIAGRRKESWRHRSVIEWHDPKAFALKWLQAEAKYVREERSLCTCNMDSDVRLGKREYVADDACLWHNAGKRLDTVSDELQAHLASQRWPIGRGVIRQEFGEWQDGKSANKRARDAWSSNPDSEHPAPNVRPELGDGATWSYWQDEIVNVAGRVSIMGTAHTATEVATLPDGRQFARGLMYHDPSLIGQSWRRADHRRQTLGNRKQWHLVARNTVPVSGTGSGRRVR